MDGALRVLLVEDSEDDALLLLRELARAGWRPEPRRVETAPALEAALAERAWDLVIADWSLPTFSAPAALAVLQKTGLDLPFIVVSGAIGEDKAVEAMKAGAHDVVLKGNLARLAPAVDRELREAAGRRERARLARTLQEQESLARLGKMAAVVAHEVRNPLAGIRASLEVIARQLTPANPVQPVIQEILERIDGLEGTIRDLLLFARPRLPRPARAPVLPFLRETAGSVSRDPLFRRVAVRIEGDAVEAPFDAELLRSALTNLLLNAAQAMGGDGEVRLEAMAFGSACRIRIADSGPGIPPEARARLFEPFFTTKHRGTGLGLAIARRVVEGHGGKIGIDCPPGGGTEVTIELPL